MSRAIDGAVLTEWISGECKSPSCPKNESAFGMRIMKHIDRMPTIEPEPKWIPCSERLPEENGEYLVTREAKGIYKYVDIVKKTNASGDIASDIVAWMPLPSAYREEGDG